MTTSAITPEVVGQEEGTQILESSPITAAEVQSRHRRMVKIKAAQLDKMERDLLIGKELLEITRTKEYRGISEGQSGLSFEDWLQMESAQMMPDAKSMSRDSATYLRGFYYFREEVLPPAATAGKGIPLPTAARQVRPLLFLLDHLRRDGHKDDRKSYDQRRAAEAKAIEIWEGACAQAKGVPTFEQVNAARLADHAAEQHRLRGKAGSSQPSFSVPSAGSSAPEPLPTPEPAVRDFSPEPPAPSIPAWELETHDDSVDAGAECKRITHALNDAFKALATLRGILYSQTHKYGSDYLDFLRQVDAGVYSLNNIDEQVQQMGEDVQFIAELLSTDVGAGELAKSTIDLEAIPTR